MREYKQNGETINCSDWVLKIGEKLYLYTYISEDEWQGHLKTIEASDIEPIGDPIQVEEEWGGDADVTRVYLNNTNELEHGNEVIAIGRLEDARFTPLYPMNDGGSSIDSISRPYWRNYEATEAFIGDEYSEEAAVKIDDYPTEGIRRRYYDEGYEYQFFDIGEVEVVYYTSWKQVETPTENPNLALLVSSESIYENNTLPLADNATLVLGGLGLYRHETEKKPYIPLNRETPDLPIVYDDDTNTLNPTDTLSIESLTSNELISNDYKSDVFLITDKANYDTNRNKLGLADGAILILRGVE